MSMLTSLCDELRGKATLYEGYQNGEISRLLREAADTILTLREEAQVSDDERAASYNLGFDSGVMAFMNQVEGIIRDKWTGNDAKVRDIRKLLDKQWKEYES